MIDAALFQPLSDLAALIDSADPGLRQQAILVGGYAVMDYLSGFEHIGEGRTTEDIDLVLVSQDAAQWRTVLQQAGWRQDPTRAFRYLNPATAAERSTVDLLSLQSVQTTKPSTSQVPATAADGEYYIVLAKAIWHEGLDQATWPWHLVEPMRHPAPRTDGWLRLNACGLFLTKLAAVQCCCEWLQGAPNPERMAAARARIPKDVQDLRNLLESLRSTPHYLTRFIGALNTDGRDRVHRNVQTIQWFARRQDVDLAEASHRMIQDLVTDLSAHGLTSDV